MTESLKISVITINSFSQRLLREASIVINELSKQALQMTLIQHDDVVK